MANQQFQNTMLEATFAFARLTLTNAILLNGAAATALLAFLGSANAETRGPFVCAISCFAWGTMSGGVASLLAYLGQRQNWEWSIVEDTPEATTAQSRRQGRMAHILIVLAILAGVAAYVLFLVGALMAARGLR